MASVTSDVWMPSQLQGITTHWPVPITLLDDIGTYIDNLPRVALDNAEAGIGTCDVLIASPVPQPLSHQAHSTLSCHF